MTLIRIIITIMIIKLLIIAIMIIIVKIIILAMTIIIKNNTNCTINNYINHNN